jgi:hypothetical protein
MADIGGYGGIIETIGGAVGSLFTSQGNAAEANSYTSAAELEQQNAQLTAASTRIQEVQQARAVSQSLGTTEADVAGAGFTSSGSALDILRSSAQQGALATSLVNIQGAINENAYAAQAGADVAKAKAANEANTAGTISAIASVGGALVNGGTQLASAGQTVVNGYNTVAGWLGGGSSSASTAGAGLTSDFSALGGGSSSALTGSGISLAGDGSIGSGAYSATDLGIQSGGLDLVSSTGTALDTSAIDLGTTTSVADAGISDAIAGGFADAAAGIGDAVAGAASVAADIGTAVAGAASDALGFVGDIIGAALSVICTAYYRRGMISQEVWMGAQLYGRRMDPDTFAGYLYWASPIARKIRRDAWFAKLMAPLLIPSIKEMSVIVGRPKARRTLYGYISHRAMYALSWTLGRIIKENAHVDAGA